MSLDMYFVYLSKAGGEKVAQYMTQMPSNTQAQHLYIQMSSFRTNETMCSHSLHYYFYFIIIYSLFCFVNNVVVFLIQGLFVAHRNIHFYF